MKVLHTVALAAGLLMMAASCGSDSKSSGTTAAATATTAAPAATTANAGTEASAVTDDSAAAGSATTAATADTISGADVTGLGDVQAKALAVTLQTAAAFGIQLDSKCLTAVLVKMSDADAQLLVDAGIGTTPSLSPEGAALSTEAAKCVLSTGTAVAAVTGTT